MVLPPPLPVATPMRFKFGLVVKGLLPLPNCCFIAFSAAAATAAWLVEPPPGEGGGGTTPTPGRRPVGSSAGLVGGWEFIRSNKSVVRMD